MASTFGGLLRSCHALLTGPQNKAQSFCNVIRYGTFCRTVVWPCLPPVLLYQYVRAKDQDYWATEVLYAKSESTDHKAFYNFDKPGAAAHWRIQMDMETIRKGANQD